jgi:hypothetical protein
MDILIGIIWSEFTILVISLTAFIVFGLMYIRMEQKSLVVLLASVVWFIFLVVDVFSYFKNVNCTDFECLRRTSTNFFGLIFSVLASLPAILVWVTKSKKQTFAESSISNNLSNTLTVSSNSKNLSNSFGNIIKGVIIGLLFIFVALFVYSYINGGMANQIVGLFI